MLRFCCTELFNSFILRLAKNELQYASFPIKGGVRINMVYEFLEILRYADMQNIQQILWTTTSMRILLFTFHEELGLSTQPCAMGAHAMAIIPGCPSVKFQFQLNVGSIFQNYKLCYHICFIRHDLQSVTPASTCDAQMCVLIIPVNTYWPISRAVCVLRLVSMADSRTERLCVHQHLSGLAVSPTYTLFSCRWYPPASQWNAILK